MAQRMRAAAILRGLSADEIAERSSLTPSQIYERWAGRIDPTQDELRDYARALGISHFWLVHGSGDPIPRAVLTKPQDPVG